MVDRGVDDSTINSSSEMTVGEGDGGVDGEVDGRGMGGVVGGREEVLMDLGGL